MLNAARLRETVRIVYHPLYLTDYSTASCETPARVSSIISDLSGRFEFITPEACGEEDVLMCHSEGILARERIDTQRFPVALMAAGGAITAAKLAMKGFVSFGVIRPPGHHASPGDNWGFCFFNNMGIALKSLLKEGLIQSATVLDIDLHFGDGTDNIFSGYRNVHVLNIQSGNPEAFIVETRTALSHIRESDIIGISAGFDQYELDWGGNLSTEDYRTIGAIAGEFARMVTKGRIFGILEGGYYVPDLGKNLIALLEGMVQGREG